MAGDLPQVGVRAVVQDKDSFISGIGEINQAVKDSGKSFNDSVKPTDAYEKALGHFQDRFDKLGGKLNQAKGLIKDVKEQTTSSGQAAEGAALNWEGMATAAGAAAVALGAVVVVNAVQWLGEMNSELSKMAAQMGITQDAAEKFAPAIRNLASTGLVDNFADAGQAIELVQTKLKGLGKEGGADVQEVARQVAGMADAWDTNVPTVVGGAQALINKFGQIDPWMATISKGFTQAGQAEGYFTTVTNTNAKEVAKLTPQIQKAKDALAAYTPVMDKHGKVTASSQEHYKRLNTNLTELEGKLKGATTTTQQWVDTATKDGPKVEKTFISAKEALDLMTRAAQEGHISVGQIATTIQTAGGYFANAGFSAKETMQIIATGAQNGVTNFTALGRSIDTFHRGIVNPPKGFNEALNEMGLSKVAAQLRTNSISMSDAMTQVFDAFDQMQDPIAADEAAMKLFGVRSDQLGGPEVLGALSHFKDALKDTKGAAQTVADVMQDDGTLGTAIKRFGAGIKSWVEDKAQSAYDALRHIDWAGLGQGITDWLNNLGPQMAAMWNQITSEVSAAWENVKTAISGALDSVAAYIANTAWPNIVSAVQNIWQAIVAVTGTIWQSIQNVVNTALASVRDTMNTIGAAISTAWKTLTDGVGATWNDWFGPGGKVPSAVNDALTQVKNFIDKNLAPVQAAFQGIIDTIMGIWNGLFGPGGTLTTTVGGAIQAVIGVVQGLVAGVQAVFAAIANAIMSALQPAINLIHSIADAIGSIGNSLHNLAATLHIGGAAGGGQLAEGLTMVGEQGPELAYKSGASVQIISNTQSKLAFKAMTAATMPAYAAAFGVFPQASPMIGGNTSNVQNSPTYNQQRTFNVNMHGVQGGNDAVRRFATMNALRRV